jgi:putative FmdB family regulatory protein
MLYDYGCESCNYMMVDVHQSIHDEPLTTCPRCNQESLQRVIYGGLGSFVKEPKTIGGLADKNWKNMGHYKRSEIEAKSKQKKLDSASPLSSSGSATSKEINNMSQSQKEKYIITGEK